MTTGNANSLADVRNWSVAARGLLLVVIVCLALLVAAPIASALAGSAGMISAAIAAAICVVSALLALVAVEPFRNPQQALVAMGIGMAVRMGPPLAAAMLFTKLAPYYVDAGILVYLALFFSMTLFTETWLTLPAQTAATTTPSTKPTRSS